MPLAYNFSETSDLTPEPARFETSSAFFAVHGAVAGATWNAHDAADFMPAESGGPVASASIPTNRELVRIALVEEHIRLENAHDLEVSSVHSAKPLATKTKPGAKSTRGAMASSDFMNSS